MTNILILAADDKSASHTTEFLLQSTDAHLTLYTRSADRLRNPDPARVTVIEGDILEHVKLRIAMAAQDFVCANLALPVAQRAGSCGLERLLFVSSQRIHTALSRQAWHSVCAPSKPGPCHVGEAVVKASDLEYMIRPPALLMHYRLRDAQSTREVEPFRANKGALGPWGTIRKTFQHLAEDARHRLCISRPRRPTPPAGLTIGAMPQEQQR
jgi:hypothetical protein